MTDRREIREDVDKVTKTPDELKGSLNYGDEETWKISIDKVKAREFLDEDFVKIYQEVCKAANEKNKALAKKLLPTLEEVLHINKEKNATVYKASELLENVEPLLEYSYVAEEYTFQLEGQCRQILNQYDATYKEVIGFRSKADTDQVDTKTAECLNLLGESIKAAEEDIDSLQQQRTVEDGRVGLSEIEEKDTIAQKLITEENDELKLIQSNCRTDLDSIKRKLDEVGKNVQAVSTEREQQKNQLQYALNNNRQKQEQLRAALRQLEEEDRDLTSWIRKNVDIQTTVEKELSSCKAQVQQMEDRIQSLLKMTNASLQLMQKMTGCVQEVIQTASREKKRIKSDLEKKHLDSNLQMRDALIAKLVFHQLRMEEVTINLNGTNEEISKKEEEKKIAARYDNPYKVKRLKEDLISIEREKIHFTERQAKHRKDLEELQKKHEQVDKQLHAGGITQLPTVKQRIQKWKQEQDRCFDDPEFGSFHSNLSHI
ncbi:interaptin-like [Dysidea avara]|uniref:interaptin-like n=1 Tax=Dysidea avara TaxID=196820 RepID=UPI0033183654